MPTTYTIPLGPLDRATPDGQLPRVQQATLGVRVREASGLVPAPGASGGAVGYVVPDVPESIHTSATSIVGACWFTFNPAIEPVGSEE